MEYHIIGAKCPFCEEDDFDLIGLKLHLIKYCGRYKVLPDDIVKSTKRSVIRNNDAVLFARNVIEGIWDRWYGELRGNANTDQMGAILSDAKQKIINQFFLQDNALIEEYERAKKEAQESCHGAHNSYGCGYDSGYREGIRWALYRGEADGK